MVVRQALQGLPDPLGIFAVYRLLTRRSRLGEKFGLLTGSRQLFLATYLPFPRPVTPDEVDLVVQKDLAQPAFQLLLARTPETSEVLVRLHARLLDQVRSA